MTAIGDYASVSRARLPVLHDVAIYVRRIAAGHGTSLTAPKLTVESVVPAMTDVAIELPFVR